MKTEKTYDELKAEFQKTINELTYFLNKYDEKREEWKRDGILERVKNG